MLKSLLFSTLLLFFACGQQADSPKERPYWFSQELQHEILFAPDVPGLATTFDAQIDFVDFSNESMDKINAAVELMKKVIASRDFQLEVLNHTYGGLRTYVDNNGFTNSQIYHLLLEGAERLRPERNNAMDVELELYFKDNNVIGYTYPTTMRIWLNTKYFNRYSPAQVAGNLTHEWLHKLGFSHAPSWSVARDHSVPYAIGRMMARHAKKLLP
jgi:hypothetical protein